MKKSELRQIIKEEWNKIMNEKIDPNAATGLAQDLESVVDSNSKYKKVIQDPDVSKKWLNFINTLLNF